MNALSTEQAATTTAQPTTKPSRPVRREGRTGRDYFYLRTLYWVNQKRMEKGLAPVPDFVPGRRHSSSQCALANTAPVRGHGFGKPEFVKRFIDRFDRNLYPWLVV